MKTAFTAVVLCAAIFLIGCHSVADSDNSNMTAQALVGYWSRSMITYPDDPIFKNTPPDDTLGSAKLTFHKHGGYVFSEDGTSHSGNYHIDGPNLILTSHEDGETIKCLFHFSGNHLILITPDGFEFQFERNP